MVFFLLIESYIVYRMIFIFGFFVIFFDYVVLYGYLDWLFQCLFLWRYGFNIFKNYNDNLFYCGGRQVIYKLYVGLCVDQ